MRFMMLMIPNLKEDDNWTPDPDQMAAMMKYNEELANAGVLLGLDGLHPTSRGARVTFADGKPRSTDGPFAEAKEVVGGYWMLQVNSKQEAVDWAMQCPADENNVIEVRQVFEMTDFPAEVQQAADSTTVQQHLEQVKGS